MHLVNLTIKTKTFPTPLKVSKVVPIQKTSKDQNTADGWRPINVVAAIAKVIERVYLSQIMEHLSANQIIGHSHHGAVRLKSTQSLVTEIYDALVKDLTEGTETALIALDQSKAYDIVDHEIMIRKL